ncbi:MAG: M20/M25/M40 family metallo-hydrolase [Kiritimatiellae bacterium]|nr:M20/M25/M40 family metallo-hydrolase [Kiritimatiellia bacterium]
MTHARRAMDLDFLRELVAIPSETHDTAAVNRATAAMRDRLSAVPGIRTATEKLGDREILWASTADGRDPDAMFLVHLDVVPAPPELYEMRREGDRVFGRGVVDDKGNAVVVAEVLRRLAGTGVSAGAVFAADEETGGETSARMAALGYKGRKIVAVMDADPWTIANAQKGTTYLTVRARGRGGHSSVPWKLDNPIEKLMEGWCKVRAAWPALPEGSEWGDTATVTKISAGDVPNQIPDTAEMTVNVRFTEPGGDQKAAEFVRKVSGLEAEVSSASFGPVFCDEKHPTLAALRDEMVRAFGREIPFTQLNGATDSRHFVGSGAPIATIGVEGGDMHCNGEWASVASCDAYAGMLEAFCKKL